MRPCSVTMDFWFHEIPYSTEVSLVPSVTMALWFHGALLWHNGLHDSMINAKALHKQ